MMQRFRALPPGLRKWLLAFFGLCVAVTLLDLVVHKHGDHWWSFFGFFSAYGFIACVALVIIATWMRRPLMRDEDYYGRDDEKERLDD